MRTILILITCLFLFSCDSKAQVKKCIKSETADNHYEVDDSQYPVMCDKRWPINYKLGFPVGYPNMKGYHDANPFGNVTSNGYHLGADLTKPGNEDYRDTIYSIGDGEVRESGGALIAIKHHLVTDQFIISSYFHCDTIFVNYCDIVKAGQPIGLVGKKFTKAAHLHFEILTDTTRRAMFYGADEKGNVDPVKFINSFNKNSSSK